MAVKKQKAKVITTIKFEDCGQDFMEWDFDSEHTIIACRPFQGSVWCGRQVDVLTNPRTGEMAALLRHGNEGQDEVTLKYPVIELTTRPSKFILLKHGCSPAGDIKYRTKTDGWSKHIKNAKVFTSEAAALDLSSKLLGQNTQVLEV